MYRLNEIQEALKNLVGWEPSFDSQLTIDTDLQESESGIVFQAAHPLLTLENVANTMPVDFVQQWHPWVQNTEYRVGDKVRHGGKTWVALENNTDTEPVGGSQYWREFSLLSEYLRKMVNRSISNMVQTFTRIKKLEQETKTLLDRKTFFDGAGRIANTVANRSRVVGLEITPVRSMGVTTKIEKVGIQLTGPATVTLYLFHSSQPSPVRSIDLEYTKERGGFQWFSLDNFLLPYVSDANDAGGAWYLVYYQEDLSPNVEAINVSKDWSREPCSTCNIGSIKTWREMSQFIQVSPFCVTPDEDFEQEPTLWDIGDMAYTNTSNYGLNCEISIGCDLTDFIVSQRSIFQDVLQKQVAYDLLRQMALNPSVRVNRNQSNVSQMDILYELDGNTSSPRPGGLGHELKKSYEALSLDTKGLDRVCLTCRNKGVRYKST